MRASLAAFAIAIAVAAALTPVVRMLAKRFGVVDRPGGRRVNTRVIPRLGGIAVVAGFFLPLLFLFGTESSLAQMFFAEPLRIVGLVAGGLVVAALGAADDIVGVRAVHKLAVQTVAACIAFGCGFRMEAIGLPFVGVVEFGVFAVPVTVIWIVGVVNALNLIDGLDGLAAGIAFFACLTAFTVATISNQPLVMLLAATLGGSILGFLLYNFNPATIFMGDSGSMFLGFVLATVSMMGSSIQGSTTVAILVPIISLGVPIMDTLFAMVRRVLERRSVFSPDRGHIHHRLLDLGITHRRAVLILYGVSVLFTGGAITVALGRNWEVGLALLLLTVAMLGLVRFVGYFEYVQIRRKQVERARSESTERFRRAVPIAIARIEGTARVEDVAAELQGFAELAGLVSIELSTTDLGRCDIAFAWQVDDVTPSGPLRETIRASYPLGKAEEGLKLRCSWRDDGPVSPQADILLQLVADACERRLARIGRVRGRSNTPRLKSV